MERREAIEIIKNHFPNDNTQLCEALKTLIPELKENEDEKIRKDLISYLKSDKEFRPSQSDTFYTKSIAWLEKQGEQKTSIVDFKAKDWYVSNVDEKIHNIYHSADNVKPKFKVGDWIACKGFHPALILNIDKDKYEIKFTDIDSIGFHNIDLVDRHFHIWTIQDAEDGDILVCGDKVNDYPFIFHNLTEELNPRSYCGVGKSLLFQYNDENCGFWCNSNEVRPATKEQRDFLFQKMKEAGYEWDNENKTIKKL